MNYEPEIIEELVHAWKKPTIGKQTRAKFIRAVLQESKLSHRQFCREFKIPKSTLFGWLVYDKISEEEYKQLKQEGVREDVIYNTLKSTRFKGKEAVAKIHSNNLTDFERDIESITLTLKEHLKNLPSMENGLALSLTRLRDTVRDILNHYRL